MTKIGVFPGIEGGTISVPPSKSYTHRALFAGLLASGKTIIENPLFSSDTKATMNAIQMFGASLTEEKTEKIIVEGTGRVQVPDNIIDVGNSGTTIRIATALAALAEKGFTVLTGDESIRNRPMGPLIDALKEIGVNVWSTRLNGLPPIIVEGGSIKGEKTKIDGSVSSQFITALLMMSPKTKNGLTINVTGDFVSRPYVIMTIKLLEKFGISVEQLDEVTYHVAPQEYKPTSFKVPADFSSAAFFIGLGALVDKEIVVKGLDFTLPQADSKIIDIVKAFGANVHVDKERGIVKVRGNTLTGIEIDLKDAPDLLPIVAVIAMRADGKTIIRGVKHARYKESDRIAVLARELQKFGVRTEELEDGLIIWGEKELKPCHLEGSKDHRLFMAFTIAAIIGKGPCIIDGFESISVSYPRFVDDLNKLGVRVKVISSE